MISISIFNKVFVITTTCMIILRSVSTTTKVHQMVKSKFELYGEYQKRDLKPYEIKMEFEDFYKTVHNLEIRGIPEPFGKYNYETYQNGLTKYCDNEYVTFDRFQRDTNVQIFKISVIELKTCMTQIMNAGNCEMLKKNIIKALEWTPAANNTNFSENVIKVATDIRNCLRGLQSFVDCLALLDKDYKEDENTKKYADELMNNLKTNVASSYLQFESCITIFKLSLHLKKKDDNITLKDLYLAESVIYHPDSNLDGIDISKLYQIYEGSPEIYMTGDNKKFCKDSIHEMDNASYTATRMSYSMLPGLYEHDDLKLFKAKKIKIIGELANVDKENKAYYDEIIEYTEKMTQEHFKDMIKRRALNHEDDYIIYAMRMNIRDHLPLPKHLWQAEFSNSKIDDFNAITDQELTEDIKLI